MNVEKRPFIISGPCSAESRDQVISTAQALKSTANYYSEWQIGGHRMDEGVLRIHTYHQEGTH